MMSEEQLKAYGGPATRLLSDRDVEVLASKKIEETPAKAVDAPVDSYIVVHLEGSEGKNKAKVLAIEPQADGSQLHTVEYLGPTVKRQEDIDLGATALVWRKVHESWGMASAK